MTLLGSWVQSTNLLSLTYSSRKLGGVEEELGASTRYFHRVVDMFYCMVSYCAKGNVLVLVDYPVATQELTVHVDVSIRLLDCFACLPNRLESSERSSACCGRSST